MSARRFETNAIHAGQESDNWSNLEIVPPIVTSVTYYQKDPTNVFDVTIILSCSSFESLS